LPLAWFFQTAEVKAGRGSDDDSHPDLPGAVLALAVDAELTMIIGNAMVCFRLKI